MSIWEVLDRAETGQYMDERDFDLKIVAKRCKELVKEHDIKFNPSEIITTDDSMADDVFEAGMKLALDTGIYCISTKRIIKFNEEEIKEGMETAPREVIVGEGRDARVLYARGIEDARRPIICGGQAGATIPEEWYVPMAMSYMKEPLIDMINHGGIAIVEGRKVRTHSPLEIQATRRELSMLREAAARSGRPGIGLIAGESSVSALGDLAIASERYMRTCDSHLVALLNELKTDYDRLSKAVNFTEYGAYNVTLVDPIIGGYAGGPEGVAICFIASFLLGRLLYKSEYHICHPIHFRYVSTSAVECMWNLNIVGQAMARNAKFIIMGDVWTSAGAGSEMIFYEIAANTITNVVTGTHPLGVSATNGKYPHASGLETKFMAEIAIASTKLNRRNANEIVVNLAKKYKDRMSNPDIGKPFPELYDVRKVVPKSEWMELYRRMKEEIGEIIGLW
ncbi:MAG: monomethylamine:corrinoid methyltransferase [Candidatus Methanomethyliaceae archaeon]|nr:monomethylamine:corrinoid methyltransferase [Candidatus Methanomethyliaceae archaeon]MDW7971526.1 monomethylamine:corrinoid methyltransferase [Nitrososphaerota archaeon]